MNLTKRVEALEAKVNAQIIEPLDIVVVIVAPDRSIVKACRYDANRQLAPVSDGELAEIRRDNQS